jgi:hypothetical protein
MSPAPLSCAAALLCLTFPSAAETLVWGQATLAAGFGGVVDSAGNGTSLSDDRVGSTEALARLGADLGRFGLGADVSYSTQAVPLTDSAFESGRLASVRASYDLTEAWTIGAVWGEGAAQPAADRRAALTFQAVEAAYALGRTGLGLQLGTFDADDEDLFHDGRFLRASALQVLRNGAVIEGEIGLFSGRQDTGSEFAMRAATWRVGYLRQIGARPLAVGIGLDGGSYTNGSGDSDNGRYDEVRVTLGLTAWFGDGDLVAARRRGLFGQPEFARILAAGSNLD